nr:hypothetical protein [Angustibacter aerolatus]
METFGGTARMQPGEQIAMSVRTLLDCSDREEPGCGCRCARRTAWCGRRRCGAGRPSGWCRGTCAARTGPGASRRSTCGAASTARRLLISNPSDLAVTVFLDSSSPQTLASSEVVSFSTRPALPLRVGAHEDRQLAVTVKGGTCTRDLDSVLQGGGGVLVLVVESAPRAGSTGLRSSMGVDLTALVGAALERDC